MERDEARHPNPEAIVWYLSRVDLVLDDLRHEVGALRLRGNQLAGFGAAILTLVGANSEAILETLGPGPRAAVGGALFTGGTCLVAAFIVALRGSAVRTESADISASEAANYLTDRFTGEPDLWRVHLRTIKALVALIDAMTQQRDATESAVRWAGRFFLAGLSTVGVALGILVVTVTLR